MNTDDFEKRLRRQQPLRELPAEWRAEILGLARKQIGSDQPAPRSFLSVLQVKLTALLWPHPKAWTALAAAWMIIASLLSYSPDRGKQIAQNAPPSSELIAVVKQQRRELAKLVEPSLPADTEPPKSFSPGPRSQTISQSKSV